MTAFEKICLTQVASIRYDNKRLHQRLESMERTSLTAGVSGIANDQSPAAEAVLQDLEWRSLPVKTDEAFLALALQLNDESKMESLVIKTQTSACKTSLYTNVMSCLFVNINYKFYFLCTQRSYFII